MTALTVMNIHIGVLCTLTRLVHIYVCTDGYVCGDTICGACGI